MKNHLFISWFEEKLKKLVKENTESLSSQNTLLSFAKMLIANFTCKCYSERFSQFWNQIWNDLITRLYRKKCAYREIIHNIRLCIQKFKYLSLHGHNAYRIHNAIYMLYSLNSLLMDDIQWWMKQMFYFQIL